MNNIWLDLTIILLALSIAGNLVLLIYALKSPKKEKRQMTYDATALLRDLASGPALVKIEYVDRADVLLRSPRHLS